MKYRILTLCMSTLMTLSLCGALYAQEDIKSLSDPSFAKWRKAPVPFNHEQHNSKAKLTDCKACHHLYTKGKLDPSGDSVGTKCSECHSVAGSAKGMPLMRAYHRQCENCHAAKAAGPITCGECHQGAPARK